MNDSVPVSDKPVAATPAPAPVAAAPAPAPVAAAPSPAPAAKSAPVALQAVIHVDVGNGGEAKMSSTTPPGPAALMWNFWPERNSAAGLLATPLQPERNYKLRVALAFARLGQEIRVALAAPAVRAAADTARKTGEAYVDVDLYAFASDPKMLVIQEGPTPLRVEIARMDAAMQTSLPSSEQILKDLAGAQPPSYVAADARIGFKTNKGAKGTYSIAIVAIDRNSGVSLDAHTVEVCVDDQCPHEAAAAPAGTNVVGQFPAQALSLVLFELRRPETTKVSALLVYETKPGGPRRHISWRTNASLAELAKLAEPVRDLLGNTEQEIAQLKENGRELADRLFVAADAERVDIDASKRARRVFARFADRAESGDPASLWIRLAPLSYGVTPSHPVIPFPLFALPKRDGKDDYFWGKAFALAVGLPSQSFTAKQCPEGWVALIPPVDFGGEDDPLRLARGNLKVSIEAWKRGTKVYSDVAAFRQWILSEPRQAQGGRVLAMLGHYDGEKFYFKANADALFANHFGQSYAGPSVALLNACESSGSAVLEGSILGQLAQHNVQSAVVTSSRVSGRLAGAYFDCLNQVLAKEPSVKMGIAHHRTLACLSDGYGNQSLKYMLYGNPDQPICAPR